MDVLQAIHYIIQSWNDVKTETIYNCWQHTSILPDNANFDITHEADDLTLDELFEQLDNLHLPDMMHVKEFLNFSDENIVYEILDDDQIIAELVNIFKEKFDENIDDPDEIDDSTETEVINTRVALKSLKIVHKFLLQQENANECIKLVNIVEKFIRKKQTNFMQQTTIDQYFD